MLKNFFIGYLYIGVIVTISLFNLINIAIKDETETKKHKQKEQDRLIALAYFCSLILWPLILNLAVKNAKFWFLLVISALLFYFS